MTRALILAAAVVGLAPGSGAAQGTSDVPAVLPQAIVDLRTGQGAGLVHAQWRYSDVKVISVSHHEPGPDLRASGAPNLTNDISPQAQAADFNDSSWEVVTPSALEQRRSHGRLAFNWYRTKLTLPEKVGQLNVAGLTVVLELVLDDYAEVWVDGKLPLVLGQTGGQLIKGFNAPNRVVLTRNARPGQQIQLAIFGINGPVSQPPANFIWVRSATLDFYSSGQLGGNTNTPAKIVRLSPQLDRIIPQGTRLEKLAGGFQFTEGPVWHPDGYLLFSDPNANTIYRWSPEGSVSVFRTKSGYTGFDIGRYHQPGSNGLTLDPDGLLTINEHGNRRVTQLERTGKITVLADHYNGKRLNSPNDLVYRSDGILYFTDPPFGLPGVPGSRKGTWVQRRIYGEGWKGDASHPGAERPQRDRLLTRREVSLRGQLGPQSQDLMRYEVNPDGTIGHGQVFHDFTPEPEPVALDGIKVDQEGNVYVSAPGGLSIISPEGKPLGRIVPPEHDANFAFGDSDSRSLYLTAITGLYRIRVGVPGIRAGAVVPVRQQIREPNDDCEHSTRDSPRGRACAESRPLSIPVILGTSQKAG